MMQLDVKINGDTVVAQNSKHVYTMTIGKQYPSRNPKSSTTVTLANVQIVNEVPYAWVQHVGAKSRHRTIQLRNFVGDYVVDFAPAQQVPRSHEVGLEDLAKRVDALQASMDKFNAALAKLQVVARAP